MGMFGFQEISDRSDTFGMDQTDQQREKVFREILGPRSE